MNILHGKKINKNCEIMFCENSSGNPVVLIETNTVSGVDCICLKPETFEKLSIAYREYHAKKNKRRTTKH